MPFFKMTANILKIDPKKSKKVLDEFVLKEFRIAAADFVREAVKHIPVDTGMARGAFLHIGRLLRVAVKINPKRSREVTIKGRKYTIDYGANWPRYYHSPAYGEKKTKELGAELTSVNDQPSSAYQTADQMFKALGGKFEFKLSSKIFHLTLNDLTGSSHAPKTGAGQPWQAFAKGQEKMMTRLTTMSKRFPAIQKFVLRSRLSVGTSGAVHKDQFAPIVQQRTIKEG